MAKPTLKYEKALWFKGYPFVIGVDEVGKGAVAGPVVAGAVALVPDFQSDYRSSPPRAGENYHPSSDFSLCSKNKILSNIYLEQIGIDDSKRLTRRKREKLVPFIKKYFYWGIGESSVDEINRLGISKATARAMRKAIKNVQCKIYNLQLRRKKIHLLLDGYQVKYLPGGLKNQKAIIHGDRKSISIAAASIIAKVYRDRLMKSMSKKYVHYGFSRHVGYGTLYHRKMLEKHGICEIHRTKFVTTFLHPAKQDYDLPRFRMGMLDKQILDAPPAGGLPE